MKSRYEFLYIIECRTYIVKVHEPEVDYVFDYFDGINENTIRCIMDLSYFYRKVPWRFI